MDEGRQSLRNLRVSQTMQHCAAAKLGSSPCTSVPTLALILSCSFLPSPCCFQGSFQAPPLSGIFPPRGVGWCLEQCCGSAVPLVGLKVNAVLWDLVWWVQ